jgi:hypothetical protein
MNGNTDGWGFRGVYARRRRGPGYIVFVRPGLGACTGPAHFVLEPSGQSPASTRIENLAIDQDSRVPGSVVLGHYFPRKSSSRTGARP